MDERKEIYSILKFLKGLSNTDESLDATTKDSINEVSLRITKNLNVDDQSVQDFLNFDYYDFDLNDIIKGTYAVKLFISSKIIFNCF